MANIIKLTEGDLHRIIKETVKNVLREYDDLEVSSYDDVIRREKNRLYKEKSKEQQISDINKFFDRLEEGHPDDTMADIFRQAVNGSEKSRKDIVYSLGVVLGVDRNLVSSEFNRRYRRRLNELEDNTPVDGLTYRQIKNVTGIEDDDYLNASVEGEENEKLEGDIWRSIVKLCNGSNPRECTFKFSDLANMLRSDYGFKYVGCNDEEESHIFMNNEHELDIFPKTYYPSQGMLRIFNVVLF